MQRHWGQGGLVFVEEQQEGQLAQAEGVGGNKVGEALADLPKDCLRNVGATEGL